MAITSNYCTRFALNKTSITSSESIVILVCKLKESPELGMLPQAPVCASFNQVLMSPTCSTLVDNVLGTFFEEVKCIQDLKNNVHIPELYTRVGRNIGIIGLENNINILRTISPH